MQGTFLVTYTLKSDERPRVHRKHFDSAEECRAWYVEQHGRFSSHDIVESCEIPFERLKMLAQLERECAELGCE